ncbi:InlB B-repeat-containing protein [Dysosmobacter welbionis]|uniref:InlB B-repeat-containing protein n=1 Tax=Dysosmobacter welbionis TaxID=2093857 RepID=UPI003993D584
MSSLSRASKGDMVTLTMSPDSSCELDHLTVRDRDGKRMNVIMESDTKYSFTMHGSEAEIEATFSKIEEPPK